MCTRRVNHIVKYVIYYAWTKRISSTFCGIENNLDFFYFETRGDYCVGVRIQILIENRKCMRGTYDKRTLALELFTSEFLTFSTRHSLRLFFFSEGV